MRLIKTWGLSFGFNDFYSVIEIDEADVITDVNYGFSGLKIGIDVGF